MRQVMCWTTQAVDRISFWLAVVHIAALLALYLIGDRIQDALLEPESLSGLAPLENLAWGLALMSACLAALSWVVPAIRRTRRSIIFAVLWGVWFGLLALAKLGAFASGAFIGENASDVTVGLSVVDTRNFRSRGAAPA
jgi:hypothetical protein